MFELKGKVAVVSGASSGLGADAARAYAQQGASVALLARRKEKLEALAAELEPMGVRVLVVPCDVTDEGQVKAAVDAIIKAFGRIDILLNNAGVAILGGVHELAEADWDRSMNVNVKGMFFVSKYIIPHMMEQQYGKIVNISSINAQMGEKRDGLGRHGYNASKSAVLGLTLGMAASYAKYNITVNAVCPALFESEMTQEVMFESEKYLAAYNRANPMGRPGNQGELNGTILYLSSDASSYVTGQNIFVDGGLSLV